VQSVLRLTTGWAARARFLAEGRVYSSPQRPDRMWGPLRLLSNGYWGLFLRWVKRQRRIADHSLPSSAEVKKGGAIPPLSYMSS
jgi:hypothetical protein